MTKTNSRRWMASILKATTASKPEMPWERGISRSLMIARRTTESAKAKLAGA